MNAKSDHVAGLRRLFEQEQDVVNQKLISINQKLVLLDQYEALEAGDASDIPPPWSDKPESGRSKKKVVKRKKVVKQKEVIGSPSSKQLSKSISKKRKNKKATSPKTRLIDQPQTSCGKGKLGIAGGSNMDKVVAIVKSLSPHWTSHDGIVEATRATHPDSPASLQAIVISVCARLRRGKYAVLGLEYRISNRRVEYRIVKTSSMGDDGGGVMNMMRRQGARAITLPIKKVGQWEQWQGIMPYPEDFSRPRTRADCVNVPRPCPYVGCPFNLYLDVNERTGSIKLNFPDLEPDEMRESCVLDVALRGELTLDEVAGYMNMTRERVRQVTDQVFLQITPGMEKVQDGQDLEG